MPATLPLKLSTIKGNPDTPHLCHPSLNPQLAGHWQCLKTKSRGPESQFNIACVGLFLSCRLHTSHCFFSLVAHSIIWLVVLGSLPFTELFSFFFFFFLLFFRSCSLAPRTKYNGVAHSFSQTHRRAPDMAGFRAVLLDRLPETACGKWLLMRLMLSCFRPHVSLSSTSVTGRGRPFGNSSMVMSMLLRDKCYPVGCI